MSICGATGSPVLDFWRHLLWVSKPEPVAVAEWVACQTGGRRFKSQHPTSAETCMWGRRLAAMLALYTGKGVSPEVNLGELISRTPPNKAEPTLFSLNSLNSVTKKIVFKNIIYTCNLCVRDWDATTVSARHK